MNPLILLPIGIALAIVGWLLLEMYESIDTDGPKKFGALLIAAGVLCFLGGVYLALDAQTNRVEKADAILAQQFPEWQKVEGPSAKDYQPGTLPKYATITPDPKAILAKYPGTSITQTSAFGQAGVRQIRYYIAMPFEVSSKFGMVADLVRPLSVSFPGASNLVVRPHEMISSKGCTPGQEWSGSLAAKATLAGHEYPFGTPVHGVLACLDTALANGGEGAWIGLHIDRVGDLAVSGVDLYIGQDPDGLASAVAMARNVVRSGSGSRTLGNAATGAAIGAAFSSRGNRGSGASTGALIGLGLDALAQAAEEAQASEQARRSVPAALIPGFTYTFTVMIPRG